jgi:hypothetical protein
MMRIAGVRWKSADPVTYADAGDLALKSRGYVVYDGNRVLELPLAEVTRDARSRN